MSRLEADNLLQPSILGLISGRIFYLLSIIGTLVVKIRQLLVIFFNIWEELKKN